MDMSLPEDWREHDQATGQGTRAMNGDDIEGLSDVEYARRWNRACDSADAAGKQRPGLKCYGIDDIQRLARRCKCGLRHDNGLTRFSVPLRLNPHFGYRAAQR